MKPRFYFYNISTNNELIQHPYNALPALSIGSYVVIENVIYQNAVTRISVGIGKSAKQLTAADFGNVVTRVKYWSLDSKSCKTFYLIPETSNTKLLCDVPNHNLQKSWYKIKMIEQHTQ